MECLYGMLECVPRIDRDVVHDAFLTVWPRLAEVQRRESLFAFCWSVAKRNRLRMRRERTIDLQPDEICDTMPDPERACAWREKWAQLIRRIESDRDRELLLRALAGERHESTCATLGISFGSYKNRKHRAVRRLRQFTS